MIRLARVGDPGAERPVVVEPDARRPDLSSVTQDVDGDSLAGTGGPWATGTCANPLTASGLGAQSTPFVDGAR